MKYKALRSQDIQNILTALANNKNTNKYLYELFKLPKKP